MKYLILLVFIGCVHNPSKPRVCFRSCSTFDRTCQERPEYNENFCVDLELDKATKK